ncbi:hypothetical protein [Catenovulum sediminis]|uniref:DUF2846 domain-containing protein n=1 Tax=Catenovulum sediminis TaxID=1740262 RepID=A0ABV1RET4_9ALTE|nr:hypothetical protein [Catenovulum sediminis]
MQLIKKLACAFGVLILSTQGAFAEFNIPGKATIVYPSGLEKTIDFGFSYENTDEGTQFSAGPFSVPVAEVPEQYSIALILHQDEYVWVQEFAKGYFTSFVYQVGNNKIELRKAPDRQIKANYELLVNGRMYLFDTNSIQLLFKFNDKGIDKIEANGAIKNIGVQ